ncbi:hypothetical protein CRM22_004383 [Opisthorchis felineus]|uniref:Uncharacterized protein n=1 Tax=Opisthorchis felineus TaxID=147828 RepID=A0A4S2LWG8_OPIFE|nr:hypothetical protein CRM22_004383 [Opisthorchis felineus]TGZ68200.1 hypothetical protein CRM22_004383 [Opisthorchis felineus]
MSRIFYVFCAVVLLSYLEEQVMAPPPTHYLYPAHMGPRYKRFHTADVWDDYGTGSDKRSVTDDGLWFGQNRIAPRV